ncbi:hypothetical protein NZK33_02940 [Cyanobium sp. FGCU-6]|nr:hypothetical protein [Cyanobium sp. FGCU6]
MAEPHEQSAAADRYAAVEAAYCDDRWQDVLDQGERLLGDLDPLDDALATALRQRLQLLMAHSHLHGFGDRDAAEDLYRQVLNTANAEPALRRSAEEGLQQCNRPIVRAAVDIVEPPALAAPASERPLPEPVAPPLTVDPAVPFAAGTASATASLIQAAATPWLAANPQIPAAVVRDAEEGPGDPSPASTPAPRLMADVVEEPELLEVHRVDPLLAEEIELALQEPAASAAPAQVKASPGDGPAKQAPERSPELQNETPPAEASPAVLEGLPLQPPPSGLATVAEAPSLLEEELFEDDEDSDLLEGLLQVALG